MAPKAAKLATALPSTKVGVAVATNPHGANATLLMWASMAPINLKVLKERTSSVSK